MAYTWDDFYRDFTKQHLHLLTPEERLEGLSSEEILEGLLSEEYFQGLSSQEQLSLLAELVGDEELEFYLKKRLEAEKSS